MVETRRKADMSLETYAIGFMKTEQMRPEYKTLIPPKGDCDL